MQSINSLSDIDKNTNLGISFGNFDGVHLGHRELIRAALEDCRLQGLKLCVMTFTPHPNLFFKSNTNFLINNYEEKKRLFEDLNVDFFWEMAFTKKFSKLSDREFLKEYFADGKIKKFYLGYDFSFGREKLGGFEQMEKFCSERSIDLYVQPKFLYKNLGVSSSLIRKKISAGEIEDSRKYLNRDFYISEVVVPGHGRGNKIGIPTANILLPPERLRPPMGVYITKSEIEGKLYKSVTNIGFNPTFDMDEKIKIETNILDFSENIYGKKIKIFFIKKIRSEKKFLSQEDLVKQINIDIQMVKDYDFPSSNR